MASFVTHRYMADLVRGSLSGKSYDLTVSYPDCYESGCQGNDILFYVLGKYRGYASLTHTRGTYEIFASMCDYVAKTRRDDLRAYLYGFICHYALDRLIHPYVIYAAANYLPAFYPDRLHKSLHLMLESGIDHTVIRTKLHENPSTFAAHDLLPVTQRVCECVADMYTGAVNPLFMTDIPYEKLLALPSRMHSYQSIFEDPSSAKYRALIAAGIFMGRPSYIYGFRKPKANKPKEDWFNLNHRLYPSHTGGNIMISDSVPEIIDKSVHDALRIISMADDCIDNGTPLPAEEFTLNFMGGKSLPLSDRPYKRRDLRTGKNE